MAGILVEGYEIRTGLFYDDATDMWVEVQDGIAHIGYDPLGLEINGTLAQLAMAGTGKEVIKGDTIGTLEAEKFVGPIQSPVSGTLVEVNEAAMDNVSKIHAQPYDSWLFAIAMSQPSELNDLISGDDIVSAFESRVAAYRVKGVLAR